MAFIRVQPNVNYQWTLPGHLRIEGKIQGSPRKMFTYITFLFVTSIEGMSLLRGKEHFFWVPKPGFNLHSRDQKAD